MDRVASNTTGVAPRKKGYCARAVWSSHYKCACGAKHIRRGMWPCCRDPSRPAAAARPRAYAPVVFLTSVLLPAVCRAMCHLSNKETLQATDVILSDVCACTLLSPARAALTSSLSCLTVSAYLSVLLPVISLLALCTPTLRG